MSVPSQHYAELANNCYEDREVGVRRPPYTEKETFEGVVYRIREHVDNPRTGYQGTVYQREGTGEIVVAHRGTEQIWKDGVLTDGAMVTSRTNRQADEAVELTRRALAYADDYGSRMGRATPEVTVTGHSLGGTLAQVSAHHFDLRGETFNAYGAASLNRRIPEGGSSVVNHVMAADAVSSASPHYGKVRIYATEREMNVLKQSGYHENRILDIATLDNPMAAAGRTLGSHSMHNFLPVDGNGKTDRSVLNGQSARNRATEHEHSIDNYRGDINSIRIGATVISRSGGGLVRDGVDYLRGTVPAGEPARREQKEADRGKGGQRTSFNMQGDGTTDDRNDVQLAQAVGGTQQDHVARLLAAAKIGDSDSIRAATQDLQSSPTGQAWQQRADNEAQQLTQRDSAQQQHSPQQQDMGRHA